jgi:hypothetical protein
MGQDLHAPVQAVVMAFGIGQRRAGADRDHRLHAMLGRLGHGKEAMREHSRLRPLLHLHVDGDLLHPRGVSQAEAHVNRLIDGDARLNDYLSNKGVRGFFQLTRKPGTVRRLRM